MATHSSTLAWKIPWMEEPGGLQSMGSLEIRDVGSIPGSVKSPGGGHGNPLQYSCLENPMDRGAGLGYSPRGRQELDAIERLHFHFHALEKETATHSSVLAWRIPGTGEPGGLLSMGLHRVGHN